MRKVSVIIRGSTARLSGANASVLEECLAFDDPTRENNKAFQQGRWDGKVRLFECNEFPAGLTTRVIAHLEAQGYRTSIIEPDEDVPTLDFERLTPEYLPGISMTGDWAHQYEALLALLRARRGCIKLPTGSGKTEVFCAGARFLWEEYGWRSLLLTSRRDLISQTVARANKYYDNDVRVGQAGDGVKDFEDCPIVIASAQTLLGYKPRDRRVRKSKAHPHGYIKHIPADAALRSMIRDYEVLWLDECHHASADSWYEIAKFSHAKRRYGMSGTPLKDEALSDAKLEGATGPLLFEVDTEELIEIGTVARPKIAMVVSENASGPELPEVWYVVENPRTGQEIRKKGPMRYRDAYVEGIVENDHHNAAVIRAVAWLADRHRKVLLVTRRKAHYQTLGTMLEAQGISFVAAWGDTETPDRKRAKADFVDGGADVLLATTIFDEGTDVPGIDALVLSEGVKINTNVIQRIGRGMRRKDGANDVLVVDFVVLCHPRLADHGLQRCETYENEGYEVVTVEDWPAKDDEDFDGDLLPFFDW